MTVAVVAAVGVTGGVGAVARFALGAAVNRRAGHGFPFGILAVNLVGAFALGLVAGLALSADASRILGTGLIGAFSTFSTWMLDTQRLVSEARRARAAANIMVSVALGLAAVWAGRRLGLAL